MTILETVSSDPESRDDNSDGTPDECGDRPVFHRGDPNDDGRVTITDPLVVLEFTFRGRATPTCREAADVDNSGSIDISDAIRLLRYLFANGSPPPQPGPPGEPCGIDPASHEKDLGYELYESCQSGR